MMFLKKKQPTFMIDRFFLKGSKCKNSWRMDCGYWCSWQWSDGQIEDLKVLVWRNALHHSLYLRVLFVYTIDISCVLNVKRTSIL